MLNMNELPKVSVIITVYNGERYIRETIQSILDQKYSNLEIILIDDGSTDNTADIIDQLPAKINYEFQENKGIAEGWNKGIHKSTGTYISFLDADDLWSKSKTHKQVRLLETKPDMDIMFGHAKEFYSEDVHRVSADLKPIPGYSAGTMMIKKERFLNVGLFNTKWIKGIFADWYLRATEAGLTVYMDEEIFLYRRIHDKNHGILKRDKYVDYLKMLKESLDRKRKS